MSIKKDYAEKDWVKEDFEAHWHEENERVKKGKISVICLFAITILAFAAAYYPAEASTAWQSVSDQSLVDAWGEE